MTALKKHRAETQRWLTAFQSNLSESFQVGPEGVDIKQFFLALDENEEKYPSPLCFVTLAFRLLAKANELNSQDSHGMDYAFSDSNLQSQDCSDESETKSSTRTYQGKPISGLTFLFSAFLPDVHHRSQGESSEGYGNHQKH